MVCSFKARDGSVAYGIQKEGKIHPVTNPVDPLEKINAQLNDWADELRNFARPVLVLGVHPGMELLHIFNLREKAVGNGLCEQSLWICVDSLPAFCGFLQTFDASEMLRSPRVQFFTKEALPNKVEWLKRNPQFPYLFTMISMSPPQVQQAVLAPMVQLIQERSALIKKVQDENEAYYAGISDEQLAEALTGNAGRKPRLMVPTCLWSTVIQYSIRDTVKAFERSGWETMVLAPEGMMTPFFAMEAINRFKPDLFLHVNHLRTESEGVLPHDMMVVSWIQDPLPYVNNHETAQKWNAMAAPRKRDLIVGYTGQLKPYGYQEDRLSPLSMIVDPEIFKPRELTPEQISTYGCDVCFASNCGLPTDRLVKEVLVHIFEEYGVDEATLMDYHDRLWDYYRDGKSITTYQQLIDFLQLDATPEDAVVQRLFWRLNDVIYRHVVIEWLDEYALEHLDFKLNLYGKGWDQHPRFAKYAQGELAHGEELSIAYQAAKYSLHLNSIGGAHQRVYEIISAGGHPLIRSDEFLNFGKNELYSGLGKLLSGLCFGEAVKSFDEIEKHALNSYFFSQMIRGLKKDRVIEEKSLLFSLTQDLWRTLIHKISWLENIQKQSFSSVATLNVLLEQTPSASAQDRVRVEALGGRSTVESICSTVSDELGEHPPPKIGDDDLLSFWPDISELIHLSYCLSPAQPDRIIKRLGANASFGVEVQFQCLEQMILSGKADQCRELVFMMDESRLSGQQKVMYALALAAIGDERRAEYAVVAAYADDLDLCDGFAKLGWHQSNKIKTPSIAVHWMMKDLYGGRMSPEWMVRCAQAVAAQDQIHAAEEIIEKAYEQSSNLKNGYSRMAWRTYVEKKFCPWHSVCYSKCA